MLIWWFCLKTNYSFDTCLQHIRVVVYEYVINNFSLCGTQSYASIAATRELVTP